MRNAKCENSNPTYLPFKNKIVRSAKCEKQNGIQQISGKSVCAKCEMRKEKSFSFRKQIARNAKCEMEREELDVLQKETGHLSWDWTFSLVGKKVT